MKRNELKQITPAEAEHLNPLACAKHLLSKCLYNTFYTAPDGVLLVCNYELFHTVVSWEGWSAFVDGDWYDARDVGYAPDEEDD